MEKIIVKQLFCQFLPIWDTFWDLKNHWTEYGLKDQTLLVHLILGVILFGILKVCFHGVVSNIMKSTEISMNLNVMMTIENNHFDMSILLFIRKCYRRIITDKLWMITNVHFFHQMESDNLSETASHLTIRTGKTALSNDD